MKAVITVIGKDAVGILAKVSNICAEHNVNVIEVTQSVLQDVFAMIMMSDISNCNIPLAKFADLLNNLGDELGLKIHVTREDLFNSMHRI